MQNPSLQKWLLLLIIFFNIYTPIVAQERAATSFCGTDRAKELNEDEAFRQKSANFERLYRQAMTNPSKKRSSSINTVYTLPVVVHVFHDNAALGSLSNPTEAQIQHEIDKATERFRHVHKKSISYTGAPYFNPLYGIDTQIELCLAGTDPNGSFTTGVLRYNDPFLNSGNVYDDAWVDSLGRFAWDRTRYSNMFIVTTLDGAAGVSYGGGSRDFTVYDDLSFKQRTIVHEIGHYLSLAHPFDKSNANDSNCKNDNCLFDGDRVCDTPPKGQPGHLPGDNCHNNPLNSCTSDENDTSINNPYRPVSMGGMGDQPDMQVNYMEYTNLACRNAFTQGQRARMRLQIENQRQTMTNNSSTACSPATIHPNDAGLVALSYTQTDICTPSAIVTVRLKNYGSNNLTNANIDLYLGSTVVQTYQWTGNIASMDELDITIPTPLTIPEGAFILNANPENPNGTTDGNVNNDGYFLFSEQIQYIGGDGCNTYSACENFSLTTNQGTGNITKVTLTDNFATAANAADAVRLCVSVEGDISSTLEKFTIKDENGNVLGQTLNNFDCTKPREICFDVNGTDFNNWATDDSVFVDLDPISTHINPTQCTHNRACVNLFVKNLPNNDCPNQRMLSGSMTGGTYDAATTIEASTTIASGENINLRAGSSITLTDGFHAVSGSTFSAMIWDCSEESSIVSESSIARSSNLGKKNIRTIPDVKIFPNPVRSFTNFMIHLSKDLPIDLVLFDLTGRIAATVASSNGVKKGVHNYELDMTTLATGTYFVFLNGRNVGKVVKM